MARTSKEKTQFVSLPLTPHQRGPTDAVITGCANGVYTVRQGRKTERVSVEDILSWVSAYDLETWENQNSLDGAAADHRRRRLNANLKVREDKGAAREEAAEKRREAQHQAQLRRNMDEELSDRRSAALLKAQARISNLTKVPSLEGMRLDSLASMAAQNPSPGPPRTDDDLDPAPNK